MKLLLCFSTFVTLATTFTLAAKTAKLHPNGNSNQSPPEKGVQKATTTTPGQHFYSCSSYQKCSLYLGPNSACNSQGRCVCEVGYEQARNGGSELCQKVTCSKVADCQGKFGAFSHCNRGSCVCDADFSYDLSLKKCFRSRPPTRRQSCSSRDCQESLGLFSSCNQEGRCVCDMGYEEQERGSFPNGSSSCQLRYCRSATDCMTKYGTNSHCNNQGICSCDTDYAYDLQLEKCTQRSIPTTPKTIIPTISSHYSCSSFSDCTRHLGTWSSCNAHGRCICDMGFEERTRAGSLSTKSSKCEQRPCSSTADCTTKYGFFSHCSVGSCSCDPGYSYDYTTGLCSSYSGNTLYHYDYYSSSSLDLGLIIGLSVAIIGLIIFIGAIIIIVRRRRQQEMAATVAARAVAVQRGQHPQNPPQNPHHPVHFQQQNLPPYTGYQPQPAPPQYQPPAPAPGFIYPSVSNGGSSSSGEQQYLNSTQRHFKS